MLQAANAATPATAATVLLVHVNVEPAGVVSVNTTLLVSPVTVLPAASCTVTVGWVANGNPPDAPTGCVVNATFAATPAVIVSELLTAEVNEPSVAVNV